MLVAGALSKRRVACMRTFRANAVQVPLSTDGALIVASWPLARLLRLMSCRFGRITLAEPNYAHLFRSDHPVFPNYLSDLRCRSWKLTSALAPCISATSRKPASARRSKAIGMTAARPDLTSIGRCLPDVRSAEAHADDAAIAVRFLGFLPLDEALPIVAEHSVALSATDLPNHHDSLPTKLSLLGVPVVADGASQGRSVVLGTRTGRVG